MKNLNYSTLTTTQLTNISGGHRVHWGRCAASVAVNEGIGAIKGGGYIGAFLGGVSGAIAAC